MSDTVPGAGGPGHPDQARARLRRWLRQRSRRARLLASLVNGRVRGVPTYLLLSGTETFGPRQVRWLRRVAGSGQFVRILVLDPHPHGARLARMFSAPRFWLDAAPGGGGPIPPDVTTGCTKVSKPHAGKPRTLYFREGRLTVAVSNRGPMTVRHHYDPHAVAYRRDEIDRDGRLVRVVDLRPSDRREVTHRYFDADGSCWLSVWVEPEARILGRTQRHRGVQREYATFREAQAAWVAEQLPAGRPPRIVPSGRVAMRVAALMRSAAATNGVSGHPRS